MVKERRELCAVCSAVGGGDAVGRKSKRGTMQPAGGRVSSLERV